jgi:hypothetical protein
MMREVHGVADAKRRCAMGATDDTNITITDGPNGMIIIDVASQSFSAEVTPEGADFLAAHLVASAERVRKQKR